MKIRLINKILIFLIIGLRPLFGIAHCKYAVTCTQFATITLQENNMCSALWIILKRVVSCNPLIQ